jgi:hypothetical protein
MGGVEPNHWAIGGVSAGVRRRDQVGARVEAHQ